MITPTLDLLELVADDMELVDAKMREMVGPDNKSLAAVIDYLVDNGGKKIRPKITLIATRFGLIDNQAAHDKAISLASAVEMLHTATLVHDDLIDNALFRRGHPTLNTSWPPGATILTGDYLFARSAGLASETENVRITQLFAATLMIIVSGEIQQFFGTSRQGPPSREDYLKRIYAKTASLFSIAAELGAILVNLPETQIQALHDYGYYFGMAFQVIDDILDFQADEDTLGKPVANDLRQGIITLPTIIFLDSHPDHPTVLKAAAKNSLTEDEIITVIDQIRASGSIREASDEARRFANQAKEALSTLPNNEYRQALVALADYAVARDF